MSEHQADGDVGTTWVALWCDAGTGEPVFVVCFVVAQSVSNYYQAVQYQPETVKVWIITAPRSRILCNGMTGLLFNRLRQLYQETTKGWFKPRAHAPGFEFWEWDMKIWEWSQAIWGWTLCSLPPPSPHSTGNCNLLKLCSWYTLFTSSLARNQEWI